MINETVLIIVTGFGPFGDHVINASWEAVKELSKLHADSKEFIDVKLIVEEIPVSYDDVASYVPKLWKEYNPTVILHVGVSHKVDCLTIECCAHSNGYERPDIYDKCPDESKITQEVLITNVDAHKICDTINENSMETECSACVSYDAGRFLCEYVFYQSLHIEPTKVLFVHVPDFTTYSSLRTAKGLLHILRCMIKCAREG
ncbi:pyroglutamyl-peptidase 1 isoform X2 [Colletes gigas]|uniref:pyroglutamyl-peptidase 1 isoform X2 n=1 Tax=Colletes gigas TaxID=935657 RepID=UPI001C9AB288|nr:pyroglutamyl-peptidase 1 isoform X2 [Colletes gigas]